MECKNSHAVSTEVAMFRSCSAHCLALERSMQSALLHRQFTVHFQPRLNLKSGKVTGCEALCRWPTPDRGMIEPNEFIPLAEKTGLIGVLGEWVLRVACEQNRIWQRLGLPPLRVSVNLSGKQLIRPGFVEVVERILHASGLAPEHLEVELTESVLIEDMNSANVALKRLRERGVYVSIDDFGTGYSSLSYLKHLPIDALKIDRSFVRDIASDADDQAITDAIVSVAHRLKLHVVAEGVETQSQLERLVACGCDEVQGYWIGAPAPPDEFVTDLRRALSKPALIG